MKKKQKTQNPVSLWGAKFSTILSISLVLFMLGAVAIFAYHAYLMSNSIKENVSFTVYLMQGAEENEIISLKETLDEKQNVRSTEYISPEDAAQMMNEIMGEDHLLVLDSINPYSASIVVNLKAKALNMSDIRSFITTVEAIDIVDSVDYRYDLIRDINSLIYNVTAFVLAFIICLLVVSITLLNHTIRLTIYSKRFMIRSMELIGAKPSFIRKPFLIKGLSYGLISGLISTAMIAAIMYWISRYFPEILAQEFYLTYGIIAGGIILFGALIAFLSTMFSVYRYMYLRNEKLYK